VKRLSSFIWTTISLSTSRRQPFLHHRKPPSAGASSRLLRRRCVRVSLRKPIREEPRRSAGQLTPWSPNRPPVLLPAMYYPSIRGSSFHVSNSSLCRVFGVSRRIGVSPPLCRMNKFSLGLATRRRYSPACPHAANHFNVFSTARQLQHRRTCDPSHVLYGDPKSDVHRQFGGALWRVVSEADRRRLLACSVRSSRGRHMFHAFFNTCVIRRLEGVRRSIYRARARIVT